MTRLHPEERPSKEQVARDLDLWSSLATVPVAIDVSDARRRLRRKLEVAIAEQDTQEQRKELAYAAIRRLQELTAPLNNALRSLSPRTQIDSATDRMTSNIVRSHGGWGGPDVVLRWQRCTLVSTLDEPLPITLRMSRCVELVGDGSLILHLLVHVGPEGVMGTNFSWERPAAAAPVGSIEAEAHA